MQLTYARHEGWRTKFQFLYRNSGIQTRYSVIPDYSLPAQEWTFYPATENLEPFPTTEQRMSWYGRCAAPLSVSAIRNCLEGKLDAQQVTHLITVSCTGMSAPGLDLQVAELMGLPKDIDRTSVNFMGCYAAIHALKMADAICRSFPDARVLMVCTELCTLHFQREATPDNIASSLLFGDGSAAALIVPDAADHTGQGVRLHSFYSEIIAKGKKDMSWDLSSTGFRMKLSNAIPDLIGGDITPLVEHALTKGGMQRQDITHWCAHPGGKKILQTIHASLQFADGTLDPSYAVLKDYGNMSSATILFVLQRIMAGLDQRQPSNIFGIAFGPGLTMETFIATT